MELTVPDVLAPLFTTPKRFKIVIGGRGSGKSTSIAGGLLLSTIAGAEKIGCFREFQNSMDDSVYALLVEEITRYEIHNSFNISANKITSKTGGSFTFKGLARNPHSIKSMQGFNKFWTEEAQAISETSLRLLTPTLREDDSELWFSANPQSRADPFSQRFIVPFEKELFKNGYYEDDEHIIILCNYKDNPWFPDVLEAERAWDEKNLSRALYRHIWLGDFNDEVEDSIIPVDHFDAAIDAHVKLGFKPKGAKFSTHDPSDMGTDDKAYCFRHGSVVFDISTKSTGDVNEGCDWSTDKAIEHGADYYIYDSDGLGASLRRQVNQAFDNLSVETIAFKGGHTPENGSRCYQDGPGDTKSKRTNKETFKNMRAQMYWRLRDRLANTYRAVVQHEYVDPDDMLSLSSTIMDMDMLRAEVCRIPRTPNGAGLIQIMSKPEMKRKGIQSPNRADALMMSLIEPKAKNNSSNIIFASGW